MEKLVALYGGSFNLSTLAHRAVGHAVRDIVQPDEVWYMVSPQNRLKSTQGMENFRHRLEMAKLNVCDILRLRVTDIEKEISEKTGSTATADTLRELQKRFPETRFAWVVGSGDFIEMHHWKDYTYILDNFPIIVMPRAGTTSQVPDCPAGKYISEITQPPTAATKNGWYIARAFPEGNLSATRARDQVHKSGTPDTRIAHPAVIDYIKQHHLQF